jgi:hypothetical protein
MPDQAKTARYKAPFGRKHLVVVHDLEPEERIILLTGQTHPV